MKKLFLLFAVIAAIFGCTRIDEPDVSQPDKILPLRTRSGEVNENPFSLDNIQMAMDAYCSQYNNPHQTLTPTHQYVRFLPQDTTALSVLYDSLELTLLPYPLDRMLSEAEIATHMNNTVNGYCWLYTTVSPGFSFPAGITHEVLDEIYMQGSDETPTRANTVQMTSIVWEAVLEKSMLLTGHQLPPPPTRAYFWYPAAVVTYHDDYTNQEIPLKGVKVLATWYTSSVAAWTNDYGYTGEMSGPGGRYFKDATQYSIQWSDSKWRILYKKNVSQCIGPKSKELWFVSLNGFNEHSTSAAIHRGLYQYYYGTEPLVADLTKPAKIDVYNYFDQFNTVFTGSFNGRSKMPDYFYIEIYGNGIKGQHERWFLTSTILHELGHATHHAAERIKYFNSLPFYPTTDDKVQESWANAVAYAHMRCLYPDHYNDGRMFVDVIHDDYTALGEALINQGLVLKRLENSLIGIKTWDEWNNSVKSQNINMNPGLIDLFFQQPIKRWQVNFKDMIEGPAVAYTNRAITYSVSPTLYGNGVRPIEWPITGSNLQYYESNDELKIVFTATGQRVIGVKVRLPNQAQSIYETYKIVNVYQSPYISLSPSTPRVGTKMDFVVQQLSGSVAQWKIEGFTSKQYQILSSTSNSLSVIFREPGTVRVIAQKLNNFYQYETIAEIEKVIPDEAAIMRFCSFENKVAPYDIWLKPYDCNTTPPSSYTYNGDRRLKNGLTNFYAFQNKPTSDHPHYANLIAIWESEWYNGYAYDKGIYTNFTPRGIKFYAFSTQLPGTQPLYHVVESEYVNAAVKTSISYVTRENKSSWKNVTSWYWNWLGTKKTGDRNWTELYNYGIVGYVYPSE